MGNEYPSSLMFGELRKGAKLQYRDAARILLSDKPIYAGRSPRDRITEKTFLSREVTHVHPDNVNPMMFGDFSQSAQTITGRMASRLGGGSKAYAQLIERFSTGEAARSMTDALNAFGRDGRIYVNTLRRVSSARLQRENDRAVLLVMAFVAAGCLADPRAAAMAVDRFTQQQLATALVTLETDTASDTTGRGDDVRPECLGLVRIVDGAMKPPIHRLEPTGESTVIGSLPEAASGITDVEVDVSRQHLRVWYQDGCWWCQGMGSTNGTTLLRAKTRELVVVEPPRVGRGSTSSEPVRVGQGDTLCLGADTRFMAIRVKG